MISTKRGSLRYRLGVGVLLGVAATVTQAQGSPREHVATAGIPASRSITPAGASVAVPLTTLPAPPLGLPAMVVPENNPLTDLKIALGRKLFFDRRLSFNRTLSCAMCHIPEQGFTQHELKTPVGIEGRFVNRNAPALYNVGYRQHLFHDGRERSLENQVWQPLLKTNEMANPSIGFVLTTLQQAGDYRGMFEQAFGRGPEVDTVGMALASYQRRLVSANSPFDRYYYGADEGAMNTAAKRGWHLFQESGCTACHSVKEDHALFTDDQFHDTGIGYARAMLPEVASAAVRLAPGVEVIPQVSFALPASNDLGRYEATGLAQDRWLYRTPSLRNVALTAPYMHDGSMPDLARVLEFYNDGGIPHPGLDPRIKPLGLNTVQLADLKAFLQGLSGDNIELLAADGRAVPIGDTFNTP